MKFLFTTLIILSGAVAHAQLVINDPYAEVREVPSFHSIVASGAIAIYLTKGNEQGVVVSNSKGKNNEISVSVSDGILYIRSNSKTRRYSTSDNNKVYISYSEIRKIQGSGAVSLQFAEALKSDKLEINLSGGSELKARVDAARLSLTLTGASDANLEGSVDQLQFVSSGASDLNAYKLVVKKADIKASGASDLKLTVEDQLTVAASGASNVFYKGQPAKTDISASGASSVVSKE